MDVFETCAEGLLYKTKIFKIYDFLALQLNYDSLSKVWSKAYGDGYSRLDE